MTGARPMGRSALLFHTSINVEGLDMPADKSPLPHDAAAGESATRINVIGGSVGERVRALVYPHLRRPRLSSARWSA